MFRRVLHSLGWLCSLAAIGTPLCGEVLPPGFRPHPSSVHALTGAVVHLSADSVLTNATIVVRAGKIVAIGSNLTVPSDARVWNYEGRVIYPGFIDPLVPVNGTNAPLGDSVAEYRAETGDSLRSAGGPYYGIETADRPANGSKTGDRLPSVHSERHIADDYTPSGKLVKELREQGFASANFSPSPGIYRGWSALINLGDHPASESLVQADTAQQIALERQRNEAYPGSLMGVIAVLRQIALDARREVALEGQPSGTPGHPRNASLNALRPLVEGKAPAVVESGSVLMEHRVVQLSDELGYPIQLVASGEEWRRPDLVARIIGRGIPWIVPVAFPALPKFPSDDDWEAVDLDRFRAWDWAPENPALLRQGNARIALTTFGLGDRKEFHAHLRAALDRGLKESDALAALTSEPARLCGVSDRLGTLSPGKMANFTITTAGGYFAEDAKVVSVWVDGEPYMNPAAEGGTETNGTPAAVKPMISAKKEVGGTPEEKEAKEKADAKKKENRELAARRVAHSPRREISPEDRPPAVLLSSVTLWTSGTSGILTNANLLAANGKILFVGATNGNALPAGTLQLDLPGVHVTPGLIDCHSHSMILAGVNEGTLPSSAMCRIGDVVNSEAATIHEQLAGGLTIANLLHGSANPIGGQNCVIKLREGEGPDELKLVGAPGGIKFALGENVKQSNWGPQHKTRYPQTRLGVPVFYANRFTAARQYLSEWKMYRDAGGIPPRRDLELEALGEILEGKRLIHCHSYRQDEIIAFLRTMESFGIRVGTLQHILEGYKVADEIARHGAGASAFADWWAYKYEVIDAIPYAGSLMRERGVTVSFNSDSDDLARRLNADAAKAVHYGGTPPEEALKFVTLNPARQLGIDSRVGSLEPGKDADFVLWNGNPLEGRSLCLQTWIDGVRYFDRAREDQRATALAEERDALLAKARKLSGADAGGPAGKPASAEGQQRFFRTSLEHERDHRLVDCLDQDRSAP